jgi:predicted short-subunit dehydrogenase-like oxidoreductase (DUF2520 family)
MSLTLNLIGAGRVGRTLVRLWAAQGVFNVQAVLSRSPQAAHELVGALGQGQVVGDLADLPAADVWLLAVPDTQIASVATALAAAPNLTPAMAWHCSGFLAASQMAPLQARGWQLASTHPALSFADAELAQRQFPGTVCALEGDAPAVAAAHTAYTAIGARCFTLQAADKPLYHGAAVFASNFLPVLQAVATELWQGTGVPPAWVHALASGFVQRAAANLQALGPRAALTGPAARGDVAVVQAQATAMAARDATLGQAYAALSELAGRLAAGATVTGAAAAVTPTAPVSPTAPVTPATTVIPAKAGIQNQR